MPFCDRAETERLVTSSPARKIRPAVGTSSPASCITSVVLPAPFGPIIACNSPASRLSDRLSAATKAPKRCTRLRVSRIGSAMGHVPPERPLEQPYDATFHEQHKEDKDGTENDLPVRRPGVENQLQDDVKGRAKHRPE